MFLFIIIIGKIHVCTSSIYKVIVDLYCCIFIFNVWSKCVVHCGSPISETIANKKQNTDAILSLVGMCHRKIGKFVFNSSPVVVDTRCIGMALWLV